MTDEDIGVVELGVRRILLPTDGSATAVEATRVAVSLAKLTGAEVVAVFVTPGNVEDPMQYIEQEQLEGVKHSSAGLEVARMTGERNGVTVTLVERSGAVASEILSAAREFDVDMIVIGSEGRTGIKRLALGSIAQSVVRESHVPVMVVRHGSTGLSVEPRN
jgi:nucleotide-binding universal stress UspA family protein